MFAFIFHVCQSLSFKHEHNLIKWNLTLLRTYLNELKRKLTQRDRRRIQKNSAIKKHQMVRKSISKAGRLQVNLGLVFHLNRPGECLIPLLKKIFVVPMACKEAYVSNSRMFTDKVCPAQDRFYWDACQCCLSF